LQPGGAIEFVSGSTAAPNLSAGAIIEEGPGEVFTGFNVSGGTTLDLRSGWVWGHGDRFFRRRLPPDHEPGRGR
jgi:hypothetical protein